MAYSIETRIDQIKQCKLLVWGDMMLDHYIWGDATRISPEAPVPVIHVDHDSYAAGGSANVALNVKSLGASAELCGVIGKDAAGEQLLTLLRDGGVQWDPRWESAEVPTIVKTRVVVRNQQLCRLDREGAPALYANQAGLDKAWIDAKLDEVDAWIFSDYAKGGLREEVVKYVCERAKGKNCLVAMDPKPQRELAFRGVDLMTPNRNESLELAGIKIGLHDAFPAEEVCARLWERYQPHYLVITLGGEGMLLCKDGQVGKRIPTLAREVFDVSGAGDTVIAALTAALASGADIEEAAHFANLAAGVVVAKVGTATVRPEEIITHAAQG